MDSSKICRTCFKTESKIKDIYNVEKVESVDFVKVLRECTSIQVTKNDTLPKKICVTCIKQIKSYYKFKQNCIKTQDKLVQYFKSLHNDSKSPTTRQTRKTKRVIKYLETSDDDDDDEKKNNLECSVKIKDLKTDSPEELKTEADDDTTKIENDDDYEFDRMSTGSNQTIENVDTKQDLSEGIPITADDIKTEIKSEPEDEGTDDNKKLMEETYSDDDFFKPKPPPKEKIACVCCYKKFKLYHELTEHMKEVHDKDHRYLCHMCAYATIEPRKFSSHLSLHKLRNKLKNLEPTFPCSTCGKKFTRISLCNHHMKTVHTDVREFACDICPARFKSNGALNKHVNGVHTGKKYDCNFCWKQFNRIENLKLHTRIHTGERPYQCKTCGEDFFYTTHLKDHIRKKHKEQKDK